MTDPIALTASLIFMFVAGFVVGYAVRAPFPAAVEPAHGKVKPSRRHRRRGDGVWVSP
ncbi:hypothetical protein [uncultured Bradyrhizobium sp.]|uniref:hypothetical protein n=1 Tax=uncultured Bradyrhizobium sp. TaxID=199684 RepID=UPI00262477FC|nr:hypothetical protein [uncultured Bradyrhizobium sp.]